MKKLLFVLGLAIVLLLSLGSVSAWTHSYGGHTGGHWNYYNGNYATYGQGYNYGTYGHGYMYAYHGGAQYGYGYNQYQHSMPRNYHRYGQYNSYNYPNGYIYSYWG